MLSVMKHKDKTTEPSGQNTGENISDLQVDPADRLRELIQTADVELTRLFARLRTPAGGQHVLHQAMADGSSIDDLFLTLIKDTLSKFCHASSFRSLAPHAKSDGALSPHSAVIPACNQHKRYYCAVILIAK